MFNPPLIPFAVTLFGAEAMRVALKTLRQAGEEAFSGEHWQKRSIYPHKTNKVQGGSWAIEAVRTVMEIRDVPTES